MRIAITTDWLNSFGGAERVLLELLDMFPQAPVYTSVFDPRHLPERLAKADVRTSFLQRIPFARRRHQAIFPLMPLAFEQFDLSEYDVVLTTNSACAKGVITPPETRNICYCHTPCRYLWDLYHEYTRERRSKALIAPVAHWMRMWDRMSADRVDHFVANSHAVASRIRHHYRRESAVVYPPVDVGRFEVADREPEDFFLVVSRLVPYKRIDLAIEAANRTGTRLLIVGDGPERKRLKRMAGPSVSLLGWRGDEEVADLYRRCAAFVFPGREDFGIAPVEAQAAGRPVIAFGRGGATETVVDGITGVLFDTQDADTLAAAYQDFRPLDYDAAACRRNAERFDREVFRERIAQAIDHGVRAPAPHAEGAARSGRLRETA